MPAKKKPTQAEKKAQRAKAAKAAQKEVFDALASFWWHPDEFVRDERMGYKRYIRGFPLMPIHSYWDHGLCMPPEFIREMVNFPSRAEGVQALASCAVQYKLLDLDLGRVMYDAVYGLDAFAPSDDSLEDERKAIVVKLPMLYHDTQQIHALSPWAQASGQSTHDASGHSTHDASSFKIKMIRNEFHDDPIWWDSMELDEMTKNIAARASRVIEFTKDGYHESFGAIQGYVTAPYDWLRNLFGATVYTGGPSEQWVLDAAIAENCSASRPSTLTNVRIIINIVTDAIIPENQPWPPEPGKETGSITIDKRNRLERNVMKQRFAVWPIGGHSYQAVRVVHKAIQMYVGYHYGKDKSDRGKERYEAYMDAVRCWPVRPSLKSVIDATQMYLDNKQDYQIKFLMPTSHASHQSINQTAASGGCTVQ